MTDSTATISELKEKVKAFRDERDWKQFHDPKELSTALIIEVAELLEHFRYLDKAQIQAVMNDASKKREVSHELADILYHVFLIAEDEGIDLSSALGEKLELTGKRYPVEKARGKNQKYTAYSTK